MRGEYSEEIFEQALEWVMGNEIRKLTEENNKLRSDIKEIDEMEKVVE